MMIVFLFLLLVLLVLLIVPIAPTIVPNYINEVDWIYKLSAEAQPSLSFSSM